MKIARLVLPLVLLSEPSGAFQQLPRTQFLRTELYTHDEIFARKVLLRVGHGELDDGEERRLLHPFGQTFLTDLRQFSLASLASVALVFGAYSGPHSLAWAEDTSASTSQSTLLQSNTQQKDPSVVDEVWTLVDKYFIDRTFNGQVSGRFSSFLLDETIG